MTKREYTALHVSAALIGMFCTAVEVASNCEHIVHQTKTLYDPAVAAVLATSVGVTIALACAMDSIRNWALIQGAMLLLAFGLGAGFTLSTTLDRVASTRDASLSVKWEADTELQALIANRKKIDYMTARECGKDRSSRACREIAMEQGISDERIEARRAEMDSMGKRLAAIFPGITPAQASLYQPMLLPVSLFLMGAFLVSFGINGRKVKPEFDTGLTGRSALKAKAERFADQFQATHGRMPQPRELEQALGVSINVARRLTRDVALVA